MFQRRPPTILIVFALLAMLIVVARGAKQSITVEEAETYLRLMPGGGEGEGPNPLLHAGLMRLATALFGTSPWTTRLPSMLGSMLYIAVAVEMAALLTTGVLGQLAILICLVFHPLVMDLLVAARGYSIGLAFLLLALLLMARHTVDGKAQDGMRRLAAIGVCLAMAVAGSYSFALVCLAAFVFAALEILWVYPGKRVRMVMVAAMPGALLSLLLSGDGVLRFPRPELTHGARSVAEMVESIVTASFFEPNRYVVNPLLLPVFQQAKPYLLAALGMSAVALLWTAARADRGVLALSTTYAFLGATAVAAHYTVFRVAGVPLPEGRTGIYFVPLTVVALSAALHRRSGKASVRRAQMALTGALALLALHHLACLRLSYFQEWQYNAAMDKGWAVASQYAHEHGIGVIAAGGMYYAPLRYYRAAAGHWRVDVVREAEAGAGRRILALHFVHDHDRIEKQGLRVLYRDEVLSDLVIAVLPEVEDGPPVRSTQGPDRKQAMEVQGAV